jgi:aarF domain-containing kinase
MFSLQDENLLPPPLAEALERVRNSADMMPIGQMRQVLDEELGQGWQEKYFSLFEERPIAAGTSRLRSTFST